MQNRKRNIRLRNIVVVGFYSVVFFMLCCGAVSFGAPAFSAGDLAGTWKAHIMNSSDTGWEGWNRSDLIVDNSGRFTAAWIDSEMDTGNDAGIISINADGILTLQGVASYEGIMTPDKKMFVMTGEYESSGDDPFFMFGIKQDATSFATSDLAGNWMAHVIHSSATGWDGWDRTNFTIDNSGDFTASWTGSAMDSGTVNGTFSLDSNGVVTMAGDASFEGVMSPDKSLFVMTGEYTAPGNDPLLMIAVKQNTTTFSTRDLMGIWKTHALYSSQTGWQGWDRSDFMVDGSGNFAAEWEDSDMDSGTVSGALSMDAKGIISTAVDPSFEGIMAFGKDVIVITNDYDNSGLAVGVLRSSYSAADYALYFPHISTRSPWQTEIALINPNSATVSGFLEGFSDSGRLMEIKQVTLSAHGRVQIVIADEFVNHDGIGYIVFNTDTNGVKGYTKFFQSGNYRAAIPAVTEVNTSNIYIPHIASNNRFWTGLSLVNTSAETKNMTITFNEGSTVAYTINAGEHKIFTVSGLFGGQPQTDIASGVISNAGGVIGLELFGNNTQLDGLLLTDDTVSTIYYPHVADMNTWWTGIVAYNPAAMGCDLTVSPYSQDGTALTPFNLSIAAGEKYIGVVKNLGMDAQTAWFKIDSTRPVSGFELFGTINGKLLAAYAEGSGAGAGQGVFAKIEKSGWTGIAFVNTENSQATVTLTAYNDNGAAIATSAINVGGHEKVVNMAEKIFNTQDISNATYIAFTSDRSVVGFQLNGSADGKMLDGLPSL